MKKFAYMLCLLTVCHSAISQEPLDVWPDKAPGETTRSMGEKMPARPEEVPTVTRMVNITRPTLSVHLANNPNGTSAIILPGGGFSKVVPDKEGTEAAEWLNQHGVSAFVLSYRTTNDPHQAGWIKPLQDAQRAMALIRSQAVRWKLRSEKIGIVAFSAGGQVAARLLADGGQLTYAAIDAVDSVSHRPDFAVLVYPWNIYDANRESLADGVQVVKDCPPTFLVHTHDDRSSSLGAALFYVGLKRNGIPAELHIYGNGGHGYGLRDVEGSKIASWTEHASHWLGTQNLLAQ
jgi:acetyl esterase/lipase